MIHVFLCVINYNSSFKIDIGIRRSTYYSVINIRVLYQHYTPNKDCLVVEPIKTVGVDQTLFCLNWYARETFIHIEVLELVKMQRIQFCSIFVYLGNLERVNLS